MLDFDFDDLRILFSKFGEVTEVIQLPFPNSNKAFVTMSAITEAFYAAKSLNGRQVMNCQARLKVGFINPFKDNLEKIKEIYNKRLLKKTTFKAIDEFMKN